MYTIKEMMKKNPVIIKALMLSFLPLLAGIILCLLDGKSIFDIYLPASEWNDEIFYYKQVEAVLEYGIPQGFFGFDESKARMLSFAAWSPMVLVPYIIWGALFGWNLGAPVLCNIVLMMIAFFMFGILAKPNGVQMGILAGLYSVSFYSIRYMLSGMSETYFIFLGILYLGLLFNYRIEEKMYKLVFIYLLVFAMTIIRPYYLVFIIYPGLLAFQRSKIWGSILTGIYTVVGISSYFLISYYFCAPYFLDIVQTYWLKHFRLAGFFEGIKYALKEILQGACEYVEICKQGVFHESEAGSLSLQFLVILLIFFIVAIAGIIKRKRDSILHITFLFSIIMIILAMFLMYQLVAGTRHLVVLITIAIFLLSQLDRTKVNIICIVALFFSMIYIEIPTQVSHSKIPYKSDRIEEEFRETEEILKNSLILDQNEVPSYNNVVIWTFTDLVGGKQEWTQWQFLYGMPAGFGINCCSGGYVDLHLDTLKNRYLLVPPHGHLDMRCVREGKKEIVRTENIVIYDLKK